LASSALYREILARAEPADSDLEEIGD